MKLKHSHQKLFLLSAAILFIASYFLIFKGGLRVSSTKTKIPNEKMASLTTNQKTYRSDFLGFEFEVPEGFEVRESGNDIVIKKGSISINIERLISYYDDEKDYMDYTSEMNNYDYSLQQTNINNFIETKISSNSKRFQDEKSYLKRIAENTFVSISTTSPELYDELDAVAESFRYTDEGK